MDFSLVSRTALFRGYTPDETEVLLQGLRAVTRRFPRDTAVYTAGKPVSNVGIVLSGTVQIENNDIWGNTSILELVKPGEVFAEAYACVPGEPMMVDVVAVEDTEILFVNVPEIFRLASRGKNDYARLIQNLVIRTSVIGISVFPSLISLWNSGMIEPRLPATFPYLTMEKLISLFPT